MLARITLSYLPSQFVGPLAQLLSMVLWTHWFAPAEVGLYVLVLSIKDFTANWGSDWWTSFTSRYMTTFTNKADASSFDFTDIVVLLGLTVLQCILVIPAAFWILGDQATPAVVTAAAILAGLEAVGRHNAARSRARHEVLRYTILVSVAPVAALLVAVATFWFVPPRVDLLLAIYAAAQALAIVFAGPLAGFKPAGGTLNRHLIKKAFFYGMPLVGAGVLYWVSSNSVRFVVANLFGTTALGLIAVGWTLGLRVTEITSMMVTSAGFPLAVERMRIDGPDAARQQLAANGALLFGVLLPSAVGLILVAPSASSILFAEAFREAAIYVMPISALLGVFRFMRSHFTDQAFLIFEQPHMLIGIGAVEAALSVALCWMGGTLFGIHGALIGFVAAIFLAFVLSFAIASRKFGLYLPWADVLRIATATLIMAGVVMLVQTDPSLITLILQASLGALSYALMIILLVPAIRKKIILILARNSSG